MTGGKVAAILLMTVLWWALGTTQVRLPEQPTLTANGANSVATAPTVQRPSPKSR